MIERPRLHRRLAGRFEADVTTIVAAAGSGKSSLVHAVVEDNLLDPHGRDVVVQLRTRDADRTAFLARVATALGVSAAAASSADRQLEAIHDTIWSAAPDDVVVWIDDAHLLDDDAVAALELLTRELPANAHVGIVSRHPIEVGLARLRAQGRVIELAQTDLDLDDDEIERLTASIDPDGAHHDGRPRHAATAALIAATGGATASVAFLQEEVIDALQPARLAKLRRLVAADRIDEQLARTLTDDDELDLADLVGGLPLVAHTPDGAARLHDLLRDALVAGMPVAELRKVRSITGDALAARHDYLGAIDAHLAAGDPVSARLAAERYVRRPTITQNRTETTGIIRRISTLDDHTPLLAALRATALQSGDVWTDELDAWRETRRLADGTGSALEALALHRVAQTRFLDIDPWAPRDPEAVSAYDRLVELSDDVDLARAAAAHIRSQTAQRRRDVDASLAALDDYDAFESPDDVLMRWQRLTDLGLVERVGEDLGHDDVGTMPPGGEVFLGYAMWLRGESPPELAEAVVGSLIEAFGDRGQRVAVAAALGTGIAIALACADLEGASGRLARLRELDRFGLPRTIRMYLAVCEGLLGAVEHSDDEGGRRFAEFGQFVEICGWPPRPHLLALPFIYVTRPDSRPTLDDIEAGPAVTTAIDAGRAIVALRDHGDTAPAARLPWSQLDVLRNNVLPHHLAELACAADVSGHPGAREMLDALPHLERQLRRVADQGAAIAAERAIELLGDLPRTPPGPIRLRLLGTTALGRGDVVDESLAQRQRPAELLALLSIRGETSRDDVIDTMWSGHDDDEKASANLRATLTQVQKLLEPGRDRSTSPYHLRTAGAILSLHGVTTDVDEFEATHRQARQADAAGTPRMALDHYLAAMAHYGGDLLAGHDAAWIVLDRVRIRSLAAGASCRIAELLAARGDVEDAASWARRALALEPLSDPAAVAFVRALMAAGDRRAAAEALAEFIDDRRRVDVAVVPALRRLEEQLPRP